MVLSLEKYVGPILRKFSIGYAHLISSVITPPSTATDKCTDWYQERMNRALTQVDLRVTRTLLIVPAVDHGCELCISGDLIV
jgi:hypothetical protein